jgi:hypothetical protein
VVSALSLLFIETAISMEVPFAGMLNLDGYYQSGLKK